MSEISTPMRGTIHGKTIELDAESGLPDGQSVTVIIESTHQHQIPVETPLDALKRAAGSWSDDPEGLERFLEWNRQQRKTEGRALPE